MTVEQIEKLRLKRCARTLVVKIGEKGILGVFEHGAAIDSMGQPLGQSGLADADGAFDSDVPKRHGKLEYIDARRNGASSRA